MGIKIFRFVLCGVIALCQVSVAAGQVWPGDVNNNGIVNGADLLYLGTVYGSTGTSRDEVDTDWESKTIVEAWGLSFPNGLDYAFADCNGDGVVNDLDIEDGIIDNFGEVHAGSGAGDYQNGIRGQDAPLKLVPSLDFANGDLSLKIGLFLGNADFEITDLYGIALQLSYKSALIDEADFSFDLTEDSWIDDQAGLNSALLFEDDDDVSKAEVAITLIDPAQRRSGAGRIGEFSIIMEDIIVGLIRDTFQIQIDSVLLLGPDHTKTSIVPDTLSFIISEDMITLSNTPQISKQVDVQLYPNPTAGRFTVASEGAIELIRVFNFLGQAIPAPIEKSNLETSIIDLTGQAPGTYIVSGRTAAGIFQKKMLVLRE